MKSLSTVFRKLAAAPTSTLLGRSLRSLLNLIPRGSIVPVLSGPLRGNRWIVGASTNGCWIGSYESEKLAMFQGELFDGAIVYDIGANVGYYALLAARNVGHSGRVYCFEPLPENQRYLARHLQINNALNCELIDCAIGRSNEIVNFRTEETRCMGALDPLTTIGIPVQVRRLDDLIAAGTLAPPNIIKCDIEGAEFDALTGAVISLQKYRPVIFLATHSRELSTKCVELSRSVGYSPEMLDATTVEDAREFILRPLDEK